MAATFGESYEPRCTHSATGRRAQEFVGANTTCTTFAVRVGGSMQRLSRTLIRLNLATRQYHTRADAGWLDLRRPSVVKQDYVEQLIKVYGFEAPLESALRYTPGVQPLVDLRARMRAGLIVQDLVRLPPPPPPGCRRPATPPPLAGAARRAAPA